MCKAALQALGDDAAGGQPADAAAAALAAGRPMRRQFMVLRFYGRKSGRRYDIPVVAHRLGGELYALTDARWRSNFRGGADVEITLDGHVTRMRGELLEDPRRSRLSMRARIEVIRLGNARVEVAGLYVRLQ